MVAVLKSLALGAAALMCAASLATAQERDANINDLVMEEIPKQELQKGRCGLFLWTRAAQPVLVLAAFANPSEARVRTGGRNRYIGRTSFAKEQMFGHFEHQVFSDGRLTFDVQIQFDGDRPVRNGAVIKDGVIRVRDQRNWESVNPVGGLIACEEN
jgi:hypothetical protein